MPQKDPDSQKCIHPELVYQFPAYIIGEGNADERRGIEEHLAGCVECRKLMKFFSDLQQIGQERFGKERSSEKR